LQEAWQLVEQLHQHTPGTACAVDAAPRLFGELTSRLRAAEALAPGANNVSPGELSNALLPLVAPLKAVTATPPGPPATGNGLTSRLARQLEPVALPEFPVLSLALAAELAERRIRPLPEGFAELRDGFNKAIDQEERTGFDAWLAKLKPADQRLAEFQGLELLARIPDLDWRVLQKALSASRLAERAAVRTLGNPRHVGDEILRGDRHRLAGEKLLLDGVAPERNSRAAAEFEAALAAYQSAESRAADDVRMVQLRNSLVFRAQDYVRWRRAAARRSDKAGPEFDVVSRFLVELKRFSDRLEQPGYDLREVAEQAARLLDLKRRIEAEASREVVQGLAGSTFGPEDIAQIEGLLETSFVPANLRQQLQTAGQSAVNAIPLTVSSFDPRRRLATPPTVLQRQRQAVSQQIELELQLAQLAAVPNADRKSRLAQMVQRAQAVRKCEQRCSEHSESTDLLVNWWHACRAFGIELQTWNRELPAQLQRTIEIANGSAAADGMAERAGRSLARTVALVSGRDYRSTATDELISQAQIGDWRELLVFLARRAESALPDLPTPSVAHISASAKGYREGAAAIRRLPALAAPAGATLEVSGPAELSLSQESDSELRLTVVNRRNLRKSAWIVVDYDRELLDLRMPADYAVYRQPDLAPTPAGKVLEAEGFYHPADQGTPPSLILEPGAERTLKFVVLRRGSRSWPTKVIVKAVGDDCDVRHECTVDIPAPEVIDLLVDGPAGGWTISPQKLTLHPFPNQRTLFQFLLRNRGVAGALDLELFALERRPETQLPTGTLPRGQADSVLRSLSLGPRLAALPDFKLEADGMTHAIAFPGPPPPDPNKPAAGDQDGKGGQTGTRELPHGALFVISERATGKVIIKQIDFAPQRPRRYVTARVDYHPDSQVVEIVLHRRENAATPARIKVRCELGNSQEPAGPKRTVTGEIAEGRSETKFSLPVPTAVQGLRLGIAIDDYPRAFLYRISSQLAGGEVAEDTGSLAVRVTSPESQSLIACPATHVNAAVEVDAPVGTFPESGGFWEIGIDKNLDRELTGDQVVRFVTDRQTRPKISGYLPDGRLAIDTPVGDFRVELPAEGVCNQRALVVAHASVLARNAWSVPVDIVLDGEGPHVTQIAVGPDRPLAAGDALEISATVVDGDLSGVARVDVAFDLEGTGRFVKDPPPMPAALSSTGTWAVKLPSEKMAPGTYDILVRAIDKVGNVGEYARTAVTIYSKEELERQRAAIRVALRGTVEYNKNPAAGIKVSLVPVDADGKTPGEKAAPAETGAAGKTPAAQASEPVPPAKTDSDGLFVLPKVPLGKYKLQAEGIVRNKIRKAEIDITIDEQTPFGPAPKLKLP
jgi:hypothetical protein